MEPNALIEDKNTDTFVRWGVPSGPALWPTVLRILFVIDGRINTSKDPSSFGLGYVLETLRDHRFAWWVQFHVQVVRRDAAVQGISPSQPDSNYTEGNEPSFATVSFRFTEPNFSLDDWDQVWFFGDYPSNDTRPITTPDFQPLENAELQLLAEWMDRGGGVFAAGDHFNLGASMCSRIPRVRTMRKWTEEQGVPTRDGDTRNETLQPNPTCTPGPACDDIREGDEFPQPIELVYRPWMTSILARPPFTHPLLSTPTGVIDRFPDHMHEGELFNDDEVALDSPLNIPGYDQPEYPYEGTVINPGVPASIAGVQPPRPRPRPHVVAYGQTTNLKSPENTALARLRGDVSSPLFTKRFGLVGAYDGDSVGIGRVVVDSTWHHWFSLNLHGFDASNKTVYANMQAYYRNVGLWLARVQRQSMLFAAAWGPVVSDPMAFPSATASLWSAGNKAVGVISRTMSQPMLYDFVGSFFSGRAERIFGVPYDINPADPYSASVPMDLAVRAIVGGIASGLIPAASEYFQATGKPRRLLDPVAIGRQAREGVRQGYLELIDAIQSYAAASKAIIGGLEDAFKPSPEVPIAVELIPLRVVAERLQLPDPTDPALLDDWPVQGLGDPTHLTITARVAIAGSVEAHTLIEDIEVPPFHSGGAFVVLNRVLYDGLVQSGESLTVEVVSGAAGRERVATERLRFVDIVNGDPPSWVGPHAPSRNQPWRLWYRVERTTIPSTRSWEPSFSAISQKQGDEHSEVNVRLNIGPIRGD